MRSLTERQVLSVLVEEMNEVADESEEVKDYLSHVLCTGQR